MMIAYDAASQATHDAGGFFGRINKSWFPRHIILAECGEINRGDGERGKLAPSRATDKAEEKSEKRDDPRRCFGQRGRCPKAVADRLNKGWMYHYLSGECALIRRRLGLSSGISFFSAAQFIAFLRGTRVYIAYGVCAFRFPDRRDRCPFLGPQCICGQEK